MLLCGRREGRVSFFLASVFSVSFFHFMILLVQNQTWTNTRPSPHAVLFLRSMVDVLMHNTEGNGVEVSENQTQLFVSLRGFVSQCEAVSVRLKVWMVHQKHQVSPVLCCVVLCHVVSCCVVSCRVVSCRVVSCRVVSCRVVLCRVVLCCVFGTTSFTTLSFAVGTSVLKRDFPPRALTRFSSRPKQRWQPDTLDVCSSCCCFWLDEQSRRSSN